MRAKGRLTRQEAGQLVAMQCAGAQRRGLKPLRESYASSLGTPNITATGIPGRQVVKVVEEAIFSQAAFARLMEVSEVSYLVVGRGGDKQGGNERVSEANVEYVLLVVPRTVVAV